MNADDITVVAVRDVEETGPVKPVCTFKYVGQVALHIFVEVAGASAEDVRVQFNRRPMETTELILEAMVIRPVRGFRRYLAIIPIPRHSYTNMSYNVANGEIHICLSFLERPVS
nr:hypothetical protein CFP56_25095 [Quercus suber]